MNLLNLIKKKNILVVGDVMLDTYFTGEVRRISPEAPVPVFRKLQERNVPGGAGNVAVNLKAADQNVSVLALVAEDSAGAHLRELLSKAEVDISMLLNGRDSTTRKTRFVAENNQQVLRLDEEDTDFISASICSRLLKLLAERISSFDLVIISDYNKGLFTEAFTQGVIKLADSAGLKTLVDVKGFNAKKYEGSFLIKPNALELSVMTGMPTAADEEVIQAARRLRDEVGCEYVLTTRGGRGMTLVGGSVLRSVNADDHKVFDVSGAGDTALAYLAAAVANGMSVVKAMEIANHASGLQVTKAGTSTVSLLEVSEIMARTSRGMARKLLRREAAAQLRWFSGDKRIVFTNGCFDILHVGHIHYLRQAAQLGDLLVVGLNSDDSVRRIKGPERPVNRQEDRAELLSSLDFIDYIIIFEEDTPYDLIRQVQPDVLVKGRDYTMEQVVGRDIVEDRGGKVVLLDLVEGRSTTGIIERIRKEQ